MFPWRGIAPVLYHLYDGGREVGRVTRRDDGTIVLALHGFATSTTAASAAWIADAARRAYEAEVGALWAGGAQPTGHGDGRWYEPDAVRELVAGDQEGELVLRRSGEEIARITSSGDAGEGGEGAAASWSARLVVGPADTPVVFALAATRRMWEAVQRSGLPLGAPSRPMEATAT